MLRPERPIDTTSFPSGSSLVIRNSSTTVKVSSRIKDTSSPIDSPGITSVEIVSTLVGVNWLECSLILTSDFPGENDPGFTGMLAFFGSVLLFNERGWLDDLSLLDKRARPLFLPFDALLSEGVMRGRALDIAIRSIRERDVFISPKATLKPDKLSAT